MSGTEQGPLYMNLVGTARTGISAMTKARTSHSAPCFGHCGFPTWRTEEIPLNHDLLLRFWWEDALRDAHSMEVAGLCESFGFQSQKMAKGCTGRLRLRSNRIERACCSVQFLWCFSCFFGKDHQLNLLNRNMNVTSLCKVQYLCLYSSFLLNRWNPTGSWTSSNYCSSSGWNRSRRPRLIKFSHQPF